MSNRVKRGLRLAIMGGLGLALLLLGLYLAPSEAYEIQAPFRDFGEPAVGVVVSKALRSRSYNDGELSYQERVVTVALPAEAMRQVEIDALVLAGDYERLGVGEQVAVTLIRGEAARAALPHGPFYLLMSSVHAGTLSLLPWAFNGRPASWKAVATIIPGFILLLLAVGLAFSVLRKPQAQPGAATPPRRLLFDWKPIDRDEPVSSDYGDNANFHVLPQPRSYNRNTVGALFRLHPLPGGFVTTWRGFSMARNLDGSPRWRLDGYGKYLAVSPRGDLVAVTGEGSGSVVVVDAQTGVARLVTERLAKYLWHVAWTADGERLLVIGDEEVIVVDGRGAVVRRLREFPGGDRPVLTGLVRMPDGLFVISHPNARLLLVVDEVRGVVRTVEEKGADNLFLGASGTSLWIGATHGVYASALPSLEPTSWFKMPGKLGVRAVGQRDEFSYVQFQPIPRAAADDKVVLVNDRTGQLWLMGAKGTPYHRWPREVLDAVEDTMWTSDDTFIVATNDRRLRKMSFYSYQPEFDVVDSPA